MLEQLCCCVIGIIIEDSAFDETWCEYFIVGHPSFAFLIPYHRQHQHSCCVCDKQIHSDIKYLDIIVLVSNSVCRKIVHCLKIGYFRFHASCSLSSRNTSADALEPVQMIARC